MPKNIANKVEHNPYYYQNRYMEFLKSNKEISKEYEVAVIVYTFDSENKIVFQRRGLGCRDEQLKLETISKEMSLI